MSKPGFILLPLYTFIVGCHNKNNNTPDEIFKAGFWTSKNQRDTLFINGVNKGSIQYLSTAPLCGSQAAKQVRFINLAPGKHLIEVKGQTGEIKRISYLLIKKTGNKSVIVQDSVDFKNSTSEAGRGSSSNALNDCLILELRY